MFHPSRCITFPFLTDEANSLEKHKHWGNEPPAYKREGAGGDFKTDREEHKERGSSVSHHVHFQNDFLHSPCMNKLWVINYMYDGFMAKFTRLGIVYCNNLLKVILRFTCHLLS